MRSKKQIAGAESKLKFSPGEALAGSDCSKKHKGCNRKSVTKESTNLKS